MHTVQCSEGVHIQTERDSEKSSGENVVSNVVSVKTIRKQQPNGTEPWRFGEMRQASNRREATLCDFGQRLENFHFWPMRDGRNVTFGVWSNLELSCLGSSTYKEA